MIEHGYDILSAGAADLDDRFAPRSGGVAVGRVHDEEGMRIRTIAIDAGATLAEHVAGSLVLIQVVAGRVRIEIGGESIELDAGGIVRAQADVAHTVHGVTAARLVLTLIDGLPRASVG